MRVDLTRALTAFINLSDRAVSEIEGSPMACRRLRHRGSFRWNQISTHPIDAGNPETLKSYSIELPRVA